MKIRTPKFKLLPKTGDYTALIYSSVLQQWIHVVIFETPFGWCVNYGNKDPLGAIYEACNLQDALSWVEKFHCDSIRKDSAWRA